MRRIQIVTVFTLILAALIFAYSQAPQSTTRLAQTATRDQKNEAGKAKRVLVKRLPKGAIGLELKDDVFRLKPGYKFERQSPNRVVVRLANNGGSREPTTAPAKKF